MRNYVKFFLVLVVLAFAINTALINYWLYKHTGLKSAEVSANVETGDKPQEKYSVDNSVPDNKKPINKIVLVSSGYGEEKHKEKKGSRSSKLNTATAEYLEAYNGNEEANTYIIKKEGSIGTITATSSEITDMLGDNEIGNVELDQKISLLGVAISSQIIRIGADQLWSYTKGEGVRIAILDSGISPHDDLRIAGGISFVGGDYHDYFGHGTQVAGIVSALLNEEGIAGTAPEAEVYSVKITHTKKGDLSTAIKGLRWAIDNNIDVVVMSFGFNDYSQIFNDLVREAYENGIILVSAAGNEGVDEVRYPSRYEDVIAVGAVDNGNIILSSSNYGQELELVAPGTGVNTTTINNGYAVVEGTSYSAAYVAGAAALLKSYDSSWDNGKVRSLLKGNALDLGEEGRDSYYGYGLVQASFDKEGIVEDGNHNFKIYNVTFEDSVAVPNFWKAFEGTVENISFSEGFYIIEREFANQVINDTLNVTEENSFKLLSTNCYTIGKGFNQERLKAAQLLEADPYQWDDICYFNRANYNCRVFTENGQANRIEFFTVFDFPFFIEDMTMDSAELSYDIQGSPSITSHDGWVEIYSTEPYDGAMTWAYKPAVKSLLATSSKISSGSYSKTQITDVSKVSDGFSGTKAYYILKGKPDGDSKVLTVINYRDTSRDTYLQACYSGAPKECDSGECCDILSGTFKAQGTACSDVGGFLCDSRDAGGCLGHAFVDQCTGTSSECPNNNVRVDYPQACYGIVCGECGKCANDGSCDFSEGIPCSTDAECNDIDPYTRDSCINPGTCNAYCDNSNYCGNGRCDSGEDELNCPEDCEPAHYCGDERCDSGENEANCPQDCDAELPPEPPQPITDGNLIYDSAGNLIADINYKYEYDGFNQLTKVKNKDNDVLSEYFYDDQGNRIKKIDYNLDGSQTKTYYPDPNFVRVVDSSGTHDTVFYYGGLDLVGRKDPDGSRYFYHPDHLGSTNVVTDINGNVVERTTYEPFGSVLEDGDSRHLFTGKELDSTELYYYEARYYNPLFAHFTQADTVIGDVYDPLSLNRYAYARNNPVKYTDPTGHFIDILADIVFIVLDVMDIVKNPASALNWGALGADIGGAATPGVTGAGRAYKALSKGSKIDKTAEAIRTADRISDLNKVDNLYDAGRSLNLPWHKRVGSWFDNLFGRGGKAGVAGEALSKIGSGSKSVMSIIGTTKQTIPNTNPFGILHPNRNNQLTKSVNRPFSGRNREGYILDMYNEGEVTVHRYGEYSKTTGRYSNIHIDLGKQHQRKLDVEKLNADNTKLKDIYPIFGP